MLQCTFFSIACRRTLLFDTPVKDLICFFVGWFVCSHWPLLSLQFIKIFGSSSFVLPQCTHIFDFSCPKNPRDFALKQSLLILLPDCLKGELPQESVANIAFKKSLTKFLIPLPSRTDSGSIILPGFPAHFPALLPGFRSFPKMAKLLSCVLGPRLYRVYRERSPARSRRLRAEPDDGSQTSLDPSWVSPLLLTTP